MIARIFWSRIVSFSIPHDCEFFHTSWSKELHEKLYAMNNITLHLAPFAQGLNTCSLLHSMAQSRSTVDCWDEYSSIFQVKVNLPTPSQMQLSSNILREANQAVTAVLKHEEVGNQASKVKSESTTRLSCLRIALVRRVWLSCLAIRNR